MPTPGQDREPLRSLADRANFSVWSTDTLRLSDLDYQRHVNNAVHAVLFTNGRFHFIQRHVRPHGAGDMPLALVRITIEYLREMHHPGEVECGTLIRRVGRSSITFGQALFSGGKCAAVAESVMVLLDPKTRRPKPLPAAVTAQLAPYVKGAGPLAPGANIPIPSYRRTPVSSDARPLRCII